MCQLSGSCLVLPEPFDTKVAQPAREKLADPGGPVGLACLTCGNVLYMGDALAARRRGEKASEDRAGSP
ncbi:hypothetical protein Sme01_59960 [Sphaerisporangium melleum]|uniref:Uncharacterized protein n=1 Tax=Sphaerisporangium melleum TaxID=321316 RepID=A0A917RBI0_9ACTN|nr:hypothetical protein GCM10007964_46150 [Sphaerisporangium melleum]GII73520.1 hypothetical protein Sme01_59960 [Sphaerisporangium melleum]